VAHNALFDYRILRTEFKRLGFEFRSETLCTVALSQELIPGQPAYSLGKLVRNLGIPVADRHRASGDALATLKLFKLLLSKDVEKKIISTFIKTEIEKGIEPKLIEIVAQLPTQIGMYYMYGEDGTLLYLGRSKNIRKSVNQHFMSDHSTSKKITAEVHRVTYEETGSELLAMLKEKSEMNSTKPKYKNRFKKKIRPFYLDCTQNSDDYLSIFQKQNQHETNNGVFTSYQEAQLALAKITHDYQLCTKINIGTPIDGPCENYPNTCKGACLKLELPESYNKRVQDFLNRYNFRDQHFILIDKGRRIGERSAILIEGGNVIGYAFVDLNYQITNLKVFRNILVPLSHQTDFLAEYRSYIIKNKRIKLNQLI
jgi:DNA polymerase-3 subunit epsilon